jgi:hypothetical protein
MICPTGSLARWNVTRQSPGEPRIFSESERGRKRRLQLRAHDLEIQRL